MIYAYNISADSRDGIVFETDETITLFIHSDPVLYGVRDYTTEPHSYSFYRVHNQEYEKNPSIIRKALGYVIEEFIDYDTIWTDDDFRALPVISDIDVVCIHKNKYSRHQKCGGLEGG